MAEDPCHDGIIIHPRREKGEKQLPKCGLFLPNPTEAKITFEALKKRGGRKQFLFHSTLWVSPEEDFFVAGPAVGAPMATLCVEKLIALGAKKLILLSCCGSLEAGLGIGDIILPVCAVSGEGTSRYYQPSERLEPDRAVVTELEQFVTGEKLDFHQGVIWSTDAPYREEKGKLEALRTEHNVSGVDMEFSALCSVAQFRNISFAALFVVSDLLLTDHWQQGFNHKQFRDRSKALIKKLITADHHIFKT